MTHDADVAIVGAGIVGLSVALELRSRGADVVVYDRALELGGGVTIRAAGTMAITATETISRSPASIHRQPRCAEFA